MTQRFDLYLVIVVDATDPQRMRRPLSRVGGIRRRMLLAARLASAVPTSGMTDQALDEPAREEIPMTATVRDPILGTRRDTS